jgi:hypothetical protein
MAVDSARVCELVRISLFFKATPLYPKVGTVRNTGSYPLES